MDDISKLYAVIMAGGRGERFWPASRYSRPKQLLPLLSERSMIEETVQRLFPLIAPERLLVVTNREFVTKIRELLPIPAENVIGEPVGRDTAPCVALAAALVKRRDPEATMVLLPADHVIHPARLFQETLCAAAEQAQAGALVTLGVAPGYAATGYGYIHIGDMVAPGFYKVLEFRENRMPSPRNNLFVTEVTNGTAAYLSGGLMRSAALFRFISRNWRKKSNVGPEPGILSRTLPPVPGFRLIMQSWRRRKTCWSAPPRLTGMISAAGALCVPFCRRMNTATQSGGGLRRLMRRDAFCSEMTACRSASSEFAIWPSFSRETAFWSARFQKNNESKS